MLVTEVMNDSPATDVGIQRYDVLLRSGDQRLVNPGQFNALMRARKPGETLSLTVFRADPANGNLSWVQNLPSGGRTPRNFDLSPDGRWLVCGHQDSTELTVFAVDPEQGTLTPTGHSATVPCCVCVLFVPAPLL